MANAEIQWSNTLSSWRIKDVLNVDDSTAYANIVTSNLTSLTTRAGIVQLTDSISSTSTSTAATPNSVKVASDQANGAFTQANNAASFANSAYAFANTGYLQANNAASFANGAFARSNSAFNVTNVAFSFANTAGSFANGAFTQANNAASFANSAYAFANTGYTQANNAASFANGAFARANSAYDVANTKYSSSGGTVSGDVTVTGNLTINGTTTTINTQTVDVTDSLIKLAKNNTSGDTIDIGFYGPYQTGGFTRYTGLFRKAADKFYFVQGLVADPTSNTTTFTSLNRSTVDANFTGGTVSGLFSPVNIADGGTNATSFTSGRLINFDGTSLASLAAQSLTTTTLATSNTLTSATIDSYGRLTALTSTPIAITSSQVSGLAASATTNTTDAGNISSGTLSSSRLPTSGVSAGTYYHANITVDTLGRVTGATSNTGIVSAFNTRTGAVTLTSNDVTTALGSIPPVINAATPKDGDIRVVASVISIYANAAWRQVFPAVYN